MAAKKGGLGKGLGALIKEEPTINTTAEKGNITSVDINKITPNKSQPRKKFDEEKLDELADSIKGIGVIQPITVKKTDDDFYVIIAGERRWRAARKAGIREIPVIVRDDITDLEALEIALIENIQREDLNPLEEAQGYKFMMDRLGITQDEAAKKVGKSRPAVANALRLLSLPDEILKMVESKELSPGHARALLGFENEDEMIAAAKLVVKKGLSVRETERLVKQSKKAPKTVTPKKRNTFYEEVELAITNSAGRRAKVNEKSKTIEIEYFDNDDLSSIVKAITGE